jgi:hypothetical protein
MSEANPSVLPHAEPVAWTSEAQSGNRFASREDAEKKAFNHEKHESHEKNYRLRKA